jgi:hypothetical protein
MVRAWVAVAAVVVLAACGTGPDDTNSSTTAPTSATSTSAPALSTATAPALSTSSSPATTPSSSETSTPETSTSLSPPTTAANALVATLPSTACALGDVVADGEITFVAEGKLFGVRPDGTGARCLAEMPAGNAGPVAWGPQADRVLLGAATVLDAAGVRGSGFLAQNRGVTWSAPTGKALIAPTVADAHLVWRSSTDAQDRLDISFLQRTDEAIYHPAGKDILSIGVDAAGTYGVFLAGNRGERARAVASAADASTMVHDLAFDTTGTRAYFLHDHGGMFHLHQLTFPDLALTDVITAQTPLAVLRVEDAGSIAWREGRCESGTTTSVISANGGQPQQIHVGVDGADGSTEPVGWLGPGRLVVMARPAGCSGAGDLWMAGPAVGTPVLVARAVDTAAIRRVLPPAADLPGDINSQAPT